MAKVRTTLNPLYTGTAGGYSFYIRKAEQVVRQRRNNSNYGEGASRSEAQQLRRVKWANLVNFFKANSPWQRKAYESLKGGQTDYNKFMSLNINNARIALTKDLASQGCCLTDNYIISHGSLPRIGMVAGGSGLEFKTDIVYTQAIGSSTTVGQFAAEVIANNEEWLEGDNLAIVYWVLNGSTEGTPYVSTVYNEVTLKSSDTTLLSANAALAELVKAEGNVVGWQYPSSVLTPFGCVVIHTRKASGSLKVSTQEIFGDLDQSIADYTNPEWVQECIDSYGIDPDVPLDPSFKSATISSVTANGSAVSNGDALQGSQQLRVNGVGLGSDTLRLTFNDIEYTPLEQGSNYLDYLLGDNGTVKIYLNGALYMVFSVSGITIPPELPQLLRMGLVASQYSSWNESKQQQNVNGNCINYDILKTQSYPLYIFYPNIQMQEEELGRFEVVNGTFVRKVVAVTGYATMSVEVTDDTKPAYITLDDFIVAVFNYTN